MASLVSASTMTTTSRKNPTLLSRVRSSRDNGFPRTASAMRNISWPPSKSGMGSRFRMARLIEKNAMKVRNQSRPIRATCPEIWPTVMMPPTSERGLVEHQSLQEPEHHHAPAPRLLQAGDNGATQRLAHVDRGWIGRGANGAVYMGPRRRAVGVDLALGHDGHLHDLSVA